MSFVAFKYTKVDPINILPPIILKKAINIRIHVIPSWEIDSKIEITSFFVDFYNLVTDEQFKNMIDDFMEQLPDPVERFIIPIKYVPKTAN